MKRITLLFSIVSLLITIPSCREDTPLDEFGQETSGINKGSTLEVSPSSINIGAGSGSTMIRVKSNTRWTVYVNNSGSSINGLSVSPLSGNGNGSITVKYGAVSSQFYQQSAGIHFIYESYGTEHIKSVTLQRRKLP